MKITYFVHGTTTDNESDIATGWNQGELSTLGIRQSQDLHKQIAGKQFDHVYCSDLRRAIQTAHIVFPGIEVTSDTRLRECNYGDFNGKQDYFKKDMYSFVEKPFSGGESYVQVERRVRNFLQEISMQYPNGHIAIVAHQAPQLALEVITNSKTWRQAIDEDWRKIKHWKPGWEYYYN